VSTHRLVWSNILSTHRRYWSNDRYERLRDDACSHNAAAKETQNAGPRPKCDPTPCVIDTFLKSHQTSNERAIAHRPAARRVFPSQLEKRRCVPVQEADDHCAWRGARCAWHVAKGHFQSEISKGGKTKGVPNRSKGALPPLPCLVASTEDILSGGLSMPLPPLSVPNRNDDIRSSLII